MTLLTLDQYFGPWRNHPDATKLRRENAVRLLWSVDHLAAIAAADGVVFKPNPKTGSIVSGQQYGGFRPQSCCEGAQNSSHKEGLAVDLYDPIGIVDAWCMRNFDHLEACGIYIEHPTATVGWSHWTIRAPGSGRRAFYP